MATKATIIPPKIGRYYARFRALEDAEGNTIDALTTNFSYDVGMRPCAGPRGGKAYQEFHRPAYYASGTFYRIESVNYGTNDDPDYRNIFTPIKCAVLTLINKDQAEESGIPRGTRIEITNGMPTRVFEFLGFEQLGLSYSVGNGRMPNKIERDLWTSDSGESFDVVADFLGLNKKKRKSPRKNVA